ncbi:hypothetical protein [Brevibacterium album]|uniref:hypothetical protein n=1 Tax=Brevibacterium album TaxID=417948 RepID=UPI0012EC39EF|nr:hypothetical protein [Brevibacterium album]
MIHAQLKERPARSTLDVDIAVAVGGDGDFTEFCAPFERIGGSEHAFRVCGAEVDVVPFGGTESSRTVRFADGNVLDVRGMGEAARTAVRVRMPRGTEVDAADLPAQAALKILAWRDRHVLNRKDAVDLATVLNAATKDPFVEHVWGDDKALEAMEWDIVGAAAFHVGGRAAVPFSRADGSEVLAVLEGEESRSMLLTDMRDRNGETLLTGFARGFAAELGREGRPPQGRRR